MPQTASQIAAWAEAQSRPSSTLTLSFRNYLNGLQGGRPTKLTIAVIEQTVDELTLAPISRDALCDKLGITPQTRRNWLKQGELDYDNGVETLECRFFDVFKRAYGFWQSALIQRVLEGKMNWAAYMTLLERLWPEQFAKRQDDSSAPKVVVNIGVAGGDVRVGVALSPPNINDLACGNQGQVEMLSPINRDYVNQLEPADAAVPTLASDTVAGESVGGPYPGGGEAQSAVGGRVKQRPRRRLLGAHKKKGPAA